MKTIIGIDVGGSTTKIVGFQNGEMITPQFVKASDPLTSLFGAFGKFTVENDIDLPDIEKIILTGVGSSYVTKPLYGLPCERAVEFDCIARGGIYLSGLSEAIVVSMGTGTAIIHARRDGDNTKIDYLGGTGVGGGTLVGLSRQILGVDTVEHIEQLCEGGDLSKIDLRISDISDKNLYPDMNCDMTASNFGKLSDLASKNDIALGITNMVGETIGMLAVFAARNHNLTRVVLTGNLTTLAPIRDVFSTMEKLFGIEFIIPEYAQYGTVIGAALGAT